MFTWKIYLVSDTFVEEDVTKDIIVSVFVFWYQAFGGADTLVRLRQLKIEEPQAVEQPDEDEISDPDEDTLAGQMAAMRGGKVKKRVEQGEDEDESSTDDDRDGNNSSSDSD